MAAPEFDASTRSPAALAAIHRFGGELLSHGCHTSAIFEALAADPDCAVAHAYAAALFLSLTTREGTIQALPHLRAAAAQAKYASERERWITAAIACWGAGDPGKAARLLSDIVTRWPHDVVSAKLCQILQLASGEAGAMVRTASHAAAADPNGYGAGLLAFALDQAGETDRAATLAARAVDRNPLTDPWAQHAMAHVHCAREDWIEGRAFLRAHAQSWERCSSFMLTHNWWHAALFALWLGDGEGALALFDDHVWGVRKGHCQDQINAVSLLARLEARGVHGGARWHDIAIHAGQRVGDAISDFADLHYLYALTRAGEDGLAERLLRSLEIRGHADGSALDQLARGVVAHARGHYYSAAIALGQARGGLARLGGSQVQRRWFDELFVDGLARARAGDGARACA
ncbi:MAG: hypothetical protein ACAH11_00420 [Sphingomonas sp.]